MGTLKTHSNNTHLEFKDILKSINYPIQYLVGILCKGTFHSVSDCE